MNDYRNTKYCPCLDNLRSKKTTLESKIHTEHRKAIDLHAQISPNDSQYKTDFIQIYNGKCAYCGASIQFIPRNMFEIDHYIPVTSDRFSSKSSAGYMDNLVLSCHTCNHNKSGFEIPEQYLDQLHPDGPGITSFFYRDDMFYIRVADGQPAEITEFYNRLILGRETSRIDYLLMNMIGLYNHIEDKSEIHDLLGKAIELLREKRNLMAE